MNIVEHSMDLVGSKVGYNIKDVAGRLTEFRRETV